ncbi:glycoside hydrolase family 3 protein [Rhodanobacter sp. Si-c]|uniref:Glycoside hydrolase family 3 protein n=1 Tax=Rhodanobacter lycopersici TaxID=3162487 RepID=A0ABV3QG97_9GAMM
MVNRFEQWHRWLRAYSLAVVVVMAPGMAMAAGSPAGLPATQHAAGAMPAHPACPWVGSQAPIADRVTQLLARMSQADKLDLVHGVAVPDPYAGRVAGIPALCIPELTLHDGPVGVRLPDTTQLPSATALAASFDPALAREYGQVIGAEDKAKGVDVDLGPTINIVRDPRWGRAFESYSEDPYLTGQVAAGTIAGVQSQGVMAQVKHWAVYNQETYRNAPQDNAVVSDRAVHELYAPAFDAAIRAADPSSVMCSYAWINGTNACEDPYLDAILRRDFGFTGFITSDWGGTHSTVAAANGGLDMEMPGDQYFGKALAAAIEAGKVPQARLDEMARRILTQEFRFGLFDRTARGHADAVASTPAHVQVALKVAEDGAVLLQNAHGLLPLGSADETIAVIGTGAGFDTLTHGGGSASVPGTGVVTPLAGIRERAARAGAKTIYAPGVIGPGEAYPTITGTHFAGSGGEGLQIEYFANAHFAGAPVATRTVPDVAAVWSGAPVPGVVAGHAFSVRWKGSLTPPASGLYTFGLTGHGSTRLVIAGKPVIDAHSAVRAPTLTQQAAEARVVAGEALSVGETRTGTVRLTAGKPVSIEVDYAFTPGTQKAEWWVGMGGVHLADAFVNLGWLLPGEQATIAAAAHAAAQANVAIVYANKFESEAFDESGIDLPGDQNALIEAVAAANPRTIVVLNTGSAVAMPWLDKVAGVIEAWYPGQQAGNAIAALLYGDVDPSGKLPVTFPRTLAQVPAATPAEWGGVDGKVHYAEGLDVGYRGYAARKLAPLFPFGFGLSYTTFAFSHLAVAPATLNAAAEVAATVDVANTGKRACAEVAQLYLAFPVGAGEPPRQLRAFAKVTLQPGARQQVSLRIPARAFATWDSARHAWHVAAGDYRVLVGDSSAHLPLQAVVHVASAGDVH